MLKIPGFLLMTDSMLFTHDWQVMPIIFILIILSSVCGGNKGEEIEGKSPVAVNGGPDASSKNFCALIGVNPKLSVVFLKYIET